MDNQASDRRLIDRIGYLASLVSEPSSVDRTLDKLRIITATSTQELSSDDIKTLESIQVELEDYLVNKERLRSFTKESLQANVERHFAAADPTRDVNRMALKQIIITIVVAAAITGTLAGIGLMKGQVVLAFFIFTLFAGVALLFRSFKKDIAEQLHGSLNYLMTATVGTGLFALHFPAIEASKYLVHHPLLQHGGLLVAAVPVYFFYYLAFYHFAKRLNVSIPWALRPLGVGATALIVAIIATALPHPVAVPHEIYFDIAVAGFAVSIYLSAAAAALGYMAVPKTTAIYSKSTFFLATSMALHTIGNGNFLVFVTFPSGTFTVNEEKGQILTGLIIVAALIFQYIAAYKTKTALR